jgi:hypothetical protein
LFASKWGLPTRRFPNKIAMVELGDNEFAQVTLEVAEVEIRLEGVPAYPRVAIVFDIPDAFDFILGMPVFEDVQSDIDWRIRKVEAVGDPRKDGKTLS